MSADTGPSPRLRRRDWLAGAGLATLASTSWPAALGAQPTDDWPDEGVPAGTSTSTDRIGQTLQWPDLDLIDGSRLPASAWQDCAAVVVFWATWCGYCRRHNAHVEQLHQRASGSHLRVLGVAIDGDPTDLRRHAADTGLHFPIAFNARQLRLQCSARRLVPLTCVVDRRARLRQVIPGEMSRSDVLGLAAYITALE
jgi:thiol-disulfide isomerase/thioredoxin